ncbi:MAG TPA: BON domain-containing protein [Terriglobia bacterium]|nr:BON domain-containing protein [Terriglobia bacterium]
MRKWSLSLGTVIFGSMLLVSACNVQSLLGPDDKAIVSEIQSKLFQDSALKTRDIHVDSNKGVVVLTGTVATDLEKAGAERLASQASGVKQVENQLTVSSSTTAQAAMPATAAPVTEPSPPEQPTTPAPERRRVRPSERAATSTTRRANAPRRASTPPRDEEGAPADAPQRPSAPVPAAAPPPPPPPPPPQPIHVTIPAGTVITVRMIDGVDSSRDRTGQNFGASVAAPVVVDGREVIRSGADARVRLTTAKNAGHMTGQSELQLQLAGVNIAGSNYDVTTTTYSQVGGSRGKRTAETVGGGAVLGGLIGAIAGHGKGAAIGSVIGAGAGTAVEAGTKAPPMKVAPETKIDFTLKAPIRVTLPPDQSGAEEPQ